MVFLAEIVIPVDRHDDNTPDVEEITRICDFGTEEVYDEMEGYSFDSIIMFLSSTLPKGYSVGDAPYSNGPIESTQEHIYVVVEDKY